MKTFPPPLHFSAIETEARERWVKLEGDPELAGPWWQLFRQVQSPRHVLSELLQNADDAHATFAKVEINDGAFVFTHDGVDFDEPSLRSLCRFGSSNKRTLATIGFRGVGFKSTFSLGSRVEVRSPTLSFAFEQQRFSKPIWIGDHDPESSLTSVRVPLRDGEIHQVIENEMERWARDPVSILFFKDLLRLELNGVSIQRSPVGTGPVQDSARILVRAREDHEFTLINSEPQQLPDEAWEEIQEERRLSGDLEERVPAQVQLILGARDSRLYVVLPTEVGLDTPFSINGPFIQDPARVRIKPPSQSPTNRWLLRKAGALAAEAMADWAGRQDLGRKTRVKAYSELLPSRPVLEAHSVTEDIVKVVVGAVGDGLQGKRFIVDAEGEMSAPPNVIALDDPLFDVWPADVLRRVWAGPDGGLMTPGVASESKRRLVRWNFVKEVPTSDVLESLSRRSLPRPEGRGRVVSLWAYIHTSLPEPQSSWDRSQVNQRLIRLRIVPVAGEDQLHSAADLLWSTGDPGFSDSDWRFLSSIVPTADPLWLAWLDKVEKEERSAEAAAGAAAALTDRFERAVRSSPRELLEKVSRAVFAVENGPEPQVGVRLAFVIARAALAPPDNFRFLCEDGGWRLAKHPVIGDPHPAEPLLPQPFLDQHLLSARYDSAVAPADRAGWSRWKRSSQSGLRRFAVPESRNESFFSLSSLTKALRRRGGEPPVETPIQRERFKVQDWDFGAELWLHWEELAQASEGLWCQLAEAIASDWDGEWRKRATVDVRQLGYSREHRVPSGGAASSWLTRLRGLPCLPDERGVPAVPSDLLRMNPRTAHLKDVERSLSPEFDLPQNDEFLSLLGVRDRADNADVLLERLTSLSGSDAPLEALKRLYETIDRSFPELPPEEQEVVNTSFRHNCLIRAADGEWYRSTQVFQANPAGISDLPVLPETFHGLALWNEIGVHREVDRDTALRFLSDLEPGTAFSDDRESQVRAILGRFPTAVWTELRCWMAGDRTWRDASEFAYYTDRTDILQSLFRHYQRQVADVSMVTLAETASISWRSAVDLSSVLEVRPTYEDTHREDEVGERWLATLGKLMARVSQLDDEPSDQYHHRVRLAEEFESGRIHVVKGLAGIPCIDENPAGPPQEFRAIWHEGVLLCADTGPAIHSDLVRALGSRAHSPALRAAIGACLDRDPQWIERYFESNFKLLVARQESRQPGKGSPESSQSRDGDDGTKDTRESPEDEDPISVGGHHWESEEEGAEERDTVEEGGDTDHRKPAKRSASGPSGSKTRPELSFFRREGFAATTRANPTRLVNLESGEVLERDSGWWLRHTSGGELVCRYLTLKGSLAEGIEISHPDYRLLFDDTAPATLLVVDERSSEVRKLSSARLRELKASGRLQLFPRSYRLRVETDST